MAFAWWDVVAKPVYTLSQIQALIDGGTKWASASVSYSIPDSLPNSGGESAGFVPLEAAMKAQATAAFALWDDVIGITLTPIATGGKISFATSSATNGGTYTSTEFTSLNGKPAAYTSAEVWLDSSWSSHNTVAAVQAGQFGFTTYLHEIGHALGLDHPGHYNGNAEYLIDAVYAQDTERFTVMSYFEGDADGSKTNWKGSDGAWHYPSTPMLHDIATAQKMYGADPTTRAGNTVYGFHATADRPVYDFTKNINPVLTIWDGAGSDTIDLSGFKVAARLDLREGRYSDAGGMTNNLAIAFGARIENGIGGTAADVITGNGFANRLSGGAGADRLLGGSGDDRLTGGAGKDVLTGGAGTDTAYYAGKQSSYAITHAGNQVVVSALTGSDGVDTLIGVEKIHFLDHTILL
jgi:serralysin